MNHQQLTVHTQNHDYPIIISAGDPPLCFDLKQYVRGRQVLVVTNDTVAPLYLDALMTSLAGFEVQHCILPDGEQYKTQASVDAIYDVLMQAHFGRDCTLIALGGGVIGDMTGFAAASFMRGVDFIQVPTTLLAQVDSSVGGKTGINHQLGKNMIGAFWQPVCVLADMATFKTLPRREFAAGMAEVIKYALIMDVSFLDWLEAYADAIWAQDGAILGEMVARSCAYKAKIVAEDEKEQGRRALLNFGHTFGHAIETHMGYGNWLHGEAVAAGMVQAACLSQLMGYIGLEDVVRIVRVLRVFELPVLAPDIAPEIALDLMGHDKKVQAGKMRFVLLHALGEAFVSADVPSEHLMQVLSQPFAGLAVTAVNES